MGLNYKVVKKSFGFDKDTERYVASAVRGGTVGFEKVIDQISLRSGISKATCRAVVETMVESACTWMLEGHGVSLGNMGYLKPSITCKSSEVSGGEKRLSGKESCSSRVKSSRRRSSRYPSRESQKWKIQKSHISQERKEEDREADSTDKAKLS